MKNVTKFLISTMLISTIVFFAGCGDSTKKDALSALDTLIENYDGGKSYEFTTHITEGDTFMDVELKRDGSGNQSFNLDLNGDKTQVYIIDNKVSVFYSDENITDFVTDTELQQFTTAIDEIESGISSSFANTKDTFNSSLLLDVVLEGEDYVITSTTSQGSECTITVSTDGTKYTYNSDVEQSAFSIVEDVKILLPQ